MAPGFVHRDCCPLCGHGSAALLCEISYGDARLREYLAEFYRGRLPLNLLRDERYRVARCDRCGFLYQDRILDADGMRALYRDWIDDDASLHKKQSASGGLFRQYARQVQTLSQMLERRPRQIRVLDFGMGWGYWARMAQAHGLAVSGFELSERRREYARALGLDVISELPDAGEHYDVIYANQVLEHLPEPLQTLRELRARLAPGGLIYLRVPDGRGVNDTLSWRGWIPELDAIHPLEHINCFIRSTLIRLGAEAGLVPASPPLRLNWGSLLGGIRREIADRFVTTHIYFRAR